MRAAEWMLVALLAAVFAPGVMTLADVWLSVDYYSHGVLVPLVALWSAAQNPVVRQPPVEPREPRGLALLLAAVAGYAAGLAAGLPSLQGVSLVGAVAALALYLWGPRGLRALAFPVGFLIFMVPVPDTWLTPLIVELQLVVSGLAAALLDTFGMPVVREGNILILPGDVSLFVAEACSGITSIVTLTPLAVMLGYLTERTLGRRLVIVASVVPLAMLGNLLRVVATVLATTAFGVETATRGPYHETAGLLTFALSCGLVIGVGPLLRRLAPEEPRRREA